MCQTKVDLISNFLAIQNQRMAYEEKEEYFQIKYENQSEELKKALKEK